MIEGGAIDRAAHAHQTGRMIEETIALGDAVDAVIHWIERHGGWEENLLIVTADHETGFLWGPGSNPSFVGIGNNGAGAMPDAVWYSWGHSNSLVPFYAKGAGADGFGRSMKGRDTVRGKYLDNTAIAKWLFELLK
jgi:alkaline phosphatase